MAAAPSRRSDGSVSMLDGRNRALFTTSPGAKPGSKWDDDLIGPYCFYSPSGNVKGKLIYANYGRKEDYNYLDNEGIDVHGAIVIVRYGHSDRKSKLGLAASKGAAAVLLYNDPADINRNNTYNVYPATWWLPGDGVEFGNFRLTEGDPATQGYPSLDNAARTSEKELEGMPKIPCHPIGYNDARVFLQNLEGPAAPQDWQGDLGFVYHVGTSSPGGLPVQVDIENKLETRRVFNVFATMKGAIEPDNVVLVGNHRDAVGYGAVDPASGTAVVLELARVFQSLASQGWQPRRTLMFCSWAAEEFGLIGSTEWVEEKKGWLFAHAVAYLNIDMILQGNYSFDMSGSASLKTAAIRAASKISDPRQMNSTLLHTWMERIPDKKNPGQPSIKRPRTNSDFRPFMNIVGVPVGHAHYSFLGEDGVKIYPFQRYPLYHTAYDTIQLAYMMDPDFAISRTVAAVMGELARDLVDSLIIPLSARDYADDICGMVQEALSDSTEKLNKVNSSASGLLEACADFSEVAKKLHEHIEGLKPQNPVDIWHLNNKLMLFERQFQRQGWNQVTSFDGLRESWQSISLANTIRAATDILRTGLP
ncbi:N-acetylated-alpha-linked acidic dipeptidase 2-like isoform X2 [Pomacea canaliculata]|uniref:N-acetylated-alpha-linked acidic dipeptidase 2-like isoform X2 n=1 Tax=Pomacea canaliculata TaxID=400727 RepID=UPI000D739DFA|nr:N-acetylated-alpha-linked acidic dipeptidase 2-like isoform X2 [Pomacea canaliculata]